MVGNDRLMRYVGLIKKPLMRAAKAFIGFFSGEYLTGGGIFPGLANSILSLATDCQ